jgi:DNA mismatch repair protein MSH5
MASVGALIDHLVRENAMSDLEVEGVAGLEICGIEMLSLFVFPPPSFDHFAHYYHKWEFPAHQFRCPFVRVLVQLFDFTNSFTTWSYSSVQIFNDESHASVHSDKTKEGLSLFGEYD